MEIVLVRHGQPDWEPDGTARDEPELTPHGHAQAACTAKALADERFDAFYVSPLRRARETAAPIGHAVGMEPVVQSWLAELRAPKMHGKTAEDVQTFFREARARDLEKHWDGLPGGESFRHMYERVSSGIEGLLVGDHRVEIHEDGGHRLWQIPDAPERLLIVAHEGTNAVIISHLLGIDPVPWAWIRFSSAWAGITRLRAVPVSTGAIFAMTAFSEVAHQAGLDGPVR